MAQLVKLSDYVSRYEIDMYRYPSRYVRLKRERWTRLKQDWEAVQGSHQLPLYQYYEEDEGIWSRTKTWMKGLRKKTEEEVAVPTNEGLRSRTLDGLKQHFRDELFDFQINWASSTVSERSRVDPAYYDDPLLRMLMEELPDTCFIFYRPVLYARKAPVDCDIIILSPNNMWILHALPGSKETIYGVKDNRYWEKREGENKTPLLKPALSLQRTKSVVQTILSERELNIPVKTGVICLEGYLDVPKGGTSTQMMDRRDVKAWKEQMQRMQAPIKNNQLKAADLLLRFTQTVSEYRAASEKQEEVEVDE
ncbi:NERD domain-containing protein [Alkalicoccus chagannorensis]|uniref:NERD domain-containing protein n=1 Tax=Alkalicoccus chagannorensis TaxID=427072 RepID=UPI0003FA7B55|nr:NERD domain-containing protein [Alkalicoccus chagannorensis]